LRAADGDALPTADSLHVPVAHSLSPSELGVLRDAAEGLSVLESAHRRQKGSETVKSQRRSVLLKLGARNITHAVALAVLDGSIAPDPRLRRPTEAA
jgi:DNA-binding NarL/FixJ family response regulator